MSRHVRSWFQNRRNPPADDSVPPPLPTFSSLPLPLWREDTLNGIACSQLFQKVPAEIRRHILIFAFGEATLHADLDMLQPLKRRFRRQHFRSTHSRTPPSYAMDTSKPWFWKRHGGVCQGSCTRTNIFSLSTLVYRDECWANCSDCDRNITPQCLIGAIGWILSCRQAYEEGIEVLYATNKIRLNEIFILEHITSLIPGANLELIESLSFKWTFNGNEDLRDSGESPGTGGGILWLNCPDPVQYPRAPAKVDEVPYFLSLLTNNFPNVVRLHISNCGVLWKDSQLAAELNASEELYRQVEDLLIKYENGLRTLDHLKHYRIGFHSSVYFPWIQIAVNKRLSPLNWYSSRYPDSIWRETSENSSLSLKGYQVSLDGWDCRPNWSLI